jgi:hypothetical protein
MNRRQEQEQAPGTRTGAVMNAKTHMSNGGGAEDHMSTAEVQRTPVGHTALL